MIHIKAFIQELLILSSSFFLVCVFNLLMWVIGSSHSEQRDVSSIFLLFPCAKIFNMVLFLCCLAQDYPQACLYFVRFFSWDYVLPPTNLNQDKKLESVQMLTLNGRMKVPPRTSAPKCMGWPLSPGRLCIWHSSRGAGQSQALRENLWMLIFSSLINYK